MKVAVKRPGTAGKDLPDHSLNSTCVIYRFSRYRYCGIRYPVPPVGMNVLHALELEEDLSIKGHRVELHHSHRLVPLLVHLRQRHNEPALGSHALQVDLSSFIRHM